MFSACLPSLRLSRRNLLAAAAITWAGAAAAPSLAAPRRRGIPLASARAALELLPEPLSGAALLDLLAEMDL